MHLRLLEMEFFTEDAEASKHFYREQLGLEMYVDEHGLKVYGSGVPNLDLIKSPHFPGTVSISFFAEDIQACVDELNAKGVEIFEQYGDPVSAIVLRDPDGVRIEIKREHG